MTDVTVTAAELGEFLGISARAVSDLGKRGIAIKAGPNLWRLKQSVARYCDELRRQVKGMGGESVVASAAAERGRLAASQADWQAMKVATRRGELLDAAAVEREWTGVLRTVRSGVLAVPARVGARLGHLKPSDVAAIDGELRSALTALGGDGAAP